MELHRTQPEPMAAENAVPPESAVPADSAVSPENAAPADGAVLPEPEPEPEPAGAPEPARPARLRGRTALVLAVAAVIGASAGTAVGFKVQADRAPTPLPALNQPGLGYPAEPLPKGREPEPLSAAEDRQVKTDGDLRKLLLPRPKGAAKGAGGKPGGIWLNVEEYASHFQNAGGMFGDFVQRDIRRVAFVAWEQGAHKVTDIKLVQFHSGRDAMEHATGQRDYMPMSFEYSAGNDGDLLKGSGNGRYYLYPVKEEAGYLPSYRARAIFQRGDVMVDIDITDTKRISKNEIRSLAERQLERLS
ncbi:hypothetical protein OHA27_15735 [Streptomyces sp. NBC_01619]|uniref:hypothetical protein n=1 Tax=unclassified Streptomyces TaxID=2593676 RepID=UPI00224CC6F3|nr:MULTISPECIES: hypothetical protein [unclassified Streptomyces]MCX4511737.1 hypothetical protein [Streptomyces sp. NBC_01619]